MPRPENDVPGDGPLADLARALRKLRERDGGTYRELAARPTVNYSNTQLAAAASGKSCPTYDVVTAYARACGATKHERTALRALWDKASAARTRRGSAGQQQRAETCTVLRTQEAEPVPELVAKEAEVELLHWEPPRPELAHTAEQYVRQLRALRAWAGNPGYKQVVRRGGNRTVASSSMYDALNRDRTKLPPLDTVIAIVRACAPDSVRAWAGTWQAISRREFEDANPMPPALPQRRPWLRAVD